MKSNQKHYLVIAVLIVASLFWQLTSLYGGEAEDAFLPTVLGGSYEPPPEPPPSLDAIVFVSRQIPVKGSVYLQTTGDMPGVGPYSRFRVAAPGKLLVREPDGTLRTLIDGSNPTPTSLNLIDVSAPDVSYDATTIAFAGLVDGDYSPNDPLTNPDAWRIYTIKVDGTDLQQVTFSDQDDLDLSQFGTLANQFKKYDDTDPVWLPDGRLVFASTRWPSFGQYSGARTSNLYVVNADGSNLHRITAERNSAERPVIDPATGKIVFSRWWRNHRYAIDSMATILDPDGSGYWQHEGLTRFRDDAVGAGNKNLQRNDWHLASVNPDGADLEMWAAGSNTFGEGTNGNHAYGGGFSPNGVFYANYFPMNNMTEAAGFGGIRRYGRGPGSYTPIMGVTDKDRPLVRNDPPSFGVHVGPYAGEPELVTEGWMIVSWAADEAQDYDLYLVRTDGTELTPLYERAGTTELRARLIRPRPLPPILSDTITNVASMLPPLEQGPYDIDGTFTFKDLNVYFNAPVDWGIVSAPPVGSAGTIRFYIDHQRTNVASFPSLDWPILLDELPINPDGSFVQPNAPANVPLFEQIRTDDDYTVPMTGVGFPGNTPTRYIGGAAHVAGMNYGRPGQEMRCVGCHTGHTLIPVPDDPEEAKWTNLAPGAEITVSSSDLSEANVGLIDLQVMLGSNSLYWRSQRDLDPNGQWVLFTFPVPVTVRNVRLYNPRFGDDANSSVQIHNSTVRLYADAAATNEVASQTVNYDLSVAGSDVPFNDVRVRAVRVELNSVSGTYMGRHLASLAEVEIIARAEAGP